MSNDPLDSFFVPNKQAPEPESIPSMRAASAKPVDARREPKLTTHTLDAPTSTEEKPVNAVRPVAGKPGHSSGSPAAAGKKAVAAPVPAPPAKKANQQELPAEKTKKELKETIKAAKQTARLAERRDRHRKSRGSRFALYLVFVVAAGLVLAIAGNTMVQSMEELRDTQPGTATAEQ